MIKNREFIVFALDHYNPLGMIRSLGEHGIHPIYIAVRHRMNLGVKSKYLKVCHQVESVEEGYALLMKEYGNYAGPKPFLLTSDDRTTGYLDEHYEELKDKFIFFNAGAAGRITDYMDKNTILQLAKKHGLNVLETRTVKRGEIPEDLVYPIITKSISPNVGGWKSDVHICNSAEELRQAYENILSPTVLIQRFIEKKNEYCLDGFCINKGKQMFAAIASTYNYLSPGYYSPYMTVTNFDNAEMQKALQGMMEEIGFEGIFSIEFLIDRDGTFYFCEINFRNSTWSYAATVAGMPLPVLWAESTLEGSISENIYKPIPDGFTAMVEPIDYEKRVMEGRASFAQWLSDFKNTNCPFYFNNEDPEPYYEMMKHFGK